MFSEGGSAKSSDTTLQITSKAKTMSSELSGAAGAPYGRRAVFRRELDSDSVDLRALKALAFRGVPEEDSGLRALVWKLLLGYLPPQRAQWAPTLQRKRAEYEQFCRELIIDPSSLGNPPAHVLNGTVATTSRSGGGVGGCNRGDSSSTAAAAALVSEAGAVAALERFSVAAEDHPLSTSDGSRWKVYFDDAEIREQIERDVARTHPDLQFFAADTPAASAHRAALRRALFVFAKLNPGLRYVQGMNELMAPLYYTFATDSDASAAAAAEADTFYCFIDLMASFRDHFCQQLDNSESGIRATMSRLSSALRAYDPSLWTHLEGRNKVNPQFYAFRWITTLMTQEFAFPDAVRMWDALLADPGGRGDCLQRLCVAMVLLVREELLAGDFAANMKLLQRYPPVDVAVVLRQADELRQYKTVLVLDE